MPRMCRDRSQAMTKASELMEKTSDNLGTCDKHQYEHCGPHERIGEYGQMMPPFPCQNWKPLTMTTPKASEPTQAQIPDDLREQYEICLLIGRENAEKVGVLPLIERIARLEAQLQEVTRENERLKHTITVLGEKASQAVELQVQRTTLQAQLSQMSTALQDVVDGNDLA